MPDTSAVKTFTDLLLTTENIIIMVAAWFLMTILRRIWPDFFKTPLMQRLLPVLPIVFTMGLIWLPGLRPDMEWGATLVLSIVLGWGAGQVHKILAQTVLGRDVALTSKNGSNSGGDSPAPPPPPPSDSKAGNA